MKLRFLSISRTIAAFVAAASLVAPTTARAQAAPAEAEDVQVLTRGPVHEAFAEAANFTPEAGVIVKTAPPAAVEELPPEQQPEGANVTWIGGYWAWDDDQNDYLWISGIWRNLPPGRQWVPGYWNDLGDGQFQWTSGYWADAAATATTYIPTPPPRNLDSGANTDAPAEDSSWIPGNYVYVDTRYVWRPGYWTPLRPNWTWVPSRYIWTPRGYVYVDGYWDYAVASRGVLFAPVYYHRHVYGDPGYYYTPSIVIALDMFADHLFVRPRYGHYYFGDYYAASYGDAGYFAAYAWSSHHHGYDPIFAYERWEHRHDRGWDLRQRNDFAYFRDHADARPPKTWALMKDLRGNNLKTGHNLMLATTFSGLTKNPAHGQKFVTLDKDRRDKFVTQNKDMVKFGQDRRKSEALGLAAGDNKKTAAFSDKLGHSPIVGLQADKLGKNDAPPKRPELHNPNLKLNNSANDKVLSDGTRKNGSLSLAGGGLKPNADNKDAAKTLDLKGKNKDFTKNPLDSVKGTDTGTKTGSGIKVDPKLSLKDPNLKNHDLQINPKGGDLIKPKSDVLPKNKDFKLDTRPKIQVDPNLKINPQGSELPKRKIETDSLPKTKSLNLNPNGNPNINPNLNPNIKPKALVEPKHDFKINPQGNDLPKRKLDTDLQPKPKNLSLNNPILQPKSSGTPKFDSPPKGLSKSLPQPQLPSGAQSTGDDNSDKRKKHNN